MSEVNFGKETNRKDKLLTFLEAMENANRERGESYEKIFKGVARVAKVQKSYLSIEDESGAAIGILKVTPQISALTKKDDHLLVTLGRRSLQWNLIQIQMLGSYVIQDGEKRMHMSMSTQALLHKIPTHTLH